MNKRIQELAEQAAMNIGDEHHPIDFFNKEKFAELIVRECMTIAQDYDGAKLGGPGLIIAMRIEQHFGVEE